MKRIFFIILFLTPLLYTNAQIDLKYNSLFSPDYEHRLFTFPLDTITGSWTYSNPLPQPLYGVNSYYYSDSNKIFICAGTNSSSLNQKTCYFYNLSNGLYEIRDSLPAGRTLGKLVRVKDSLYLIGSIGTSFTSPDGAVFRYSLKTNQWTVKAPMPSPVLHESAVCVWHDSLIISIGGSVSAYSGSNNIVRVYDPYADLWRTLNNSSFPVQITTAHAECIGNEVVVFGGWSTTFSNTVYRATAYANSIDSLRWRGPLPTPYGIGVYRVGGGKMNNYMLFGPALRNTTAYCDIWGFNITDSSWRKFNPPPSDSVANVPSVSVKIVNDSVYYFYLFGGILSRTLMITASVQKYSSPAALVKIQNNNNEILSSFRLYQNYPNPFNPTTKIRFDIPQFVILRSEATKNPYVTLKLYNLLGQEVASLVNENLKAGSYEVEWDGSNYPSGIYYYKLMTSDFSETKKLVLIK